MGKISLSSCINGSSTTVSSLYPLRWSSADTPEDRSKELMTQDEVYGALVTKFFEVNDYPQLAWMHHIACKRYCQAAVSLIAVDGQTQNLSEKHVRL
jgi:nuclear pore complex protein Nup133